VEYLGFVVNGTGADMDPAKVKVILDWPTPKTLTKLRSFIGFCNFYRHFLNDFSRMARPLHDLTKKDVKFEWTEDRQKAFEDIKKAITSAPCLIHPDPQKPFFIEADAS
jgi:hypothetical protein